MEQSPRPRPSVCVWELTLACQARCAHCGSDAGPPRPEELTTAEALEVIQDLARLGCQAVTLSGGEPLLRPDWPKLALAIRGAGMELEMITNGLLVSDQAETMASLGFSGVTFSVDGTEGVHDALRGVPGGLASLLEGAAALRQRGIRVGAVTQVNTRNLDCLGGIHELLLEHGFDGWQLQLTMPQGRAAAARGLCLRPEQLPALERTILRLQDHGALFIQAADNLGYMSRQEPRLRSGTGRSDMCWVGCQAGLQVVGLTSDGRVRGCLSLPSGFDEGSVRRRSLAAIWEDPDAFAFARQFHQGQLSSPCVACPLGEVCRAGCSSLAFAASGSPHGNPYCLWRLQQAP